MTVRWAPRSTGPIVIDFGAYALRVAQRIRAGRRAVWSGECHYYPPRQAGGRPNAEETNEALRQLLRGRRLRGRRVISALPMHEVTVKNLRLPMMAEGDLAPAVRFETLERISGLDADAEVRFFRAGALPARGEAQQEIVVLATSAAAVRAHLELLRGLGLESVGIDTPVLSALRPHLLRLRRDSDRERVTALADLGWSGMRLTIARGADVVFLKQFSFGGEQLDQLAAQALGISLPDAGNLRRRLSTQRNSSGAPAVSESEVFALEQALRPGWEQIGRDIGLGLRYHAVTFRGPRPSEVVCVGGEALDAWGLEILSHAAGTPCRPCTGIAGLDPLEEAEVPEFMDQPDWIAAAGLALKPIRRTIGAAA